MEASLANSSPSTQAAVVLAFFLSMFSAGCTASPAVHRGESASTVSAQAPEQTTAPASSGGPQEGVKVHGHWTIEVRDPDGTLVTQREFENALTPAGAATLIRILARQNAPGFWRVILIGSPTVCPTGNCEITEGTGLAVDGRPISNVFGGLTVTASPSGTSPNRLALTGSATAGNITTVAQVTTNLHLCNAGTLPPGRGCEATGPGAGGPSFVITSTSLNPAVSVTSGQQIQITVVMSFS